jgi:beta-ribofuranosylaminobenzene 5'-phosphate synthase
MSDSVAVAVPARLHLGFLDLDATLGRRFGSIGLGLDRPLTRIVVRHAPAMGIEGADAERAARHVAALQAALGLKGSYRLEVRAAIPPHAGLGSGTQLALAIAAGLRTLHGLPLDTRGDAELLGRGQRSGIGIALFERGGVVVDGGRTDKGGPPPAVAHLPFPKGWRVLLLLDRQARGLHGTAESEAFSRLPPFPATMAAHLCHLTLLKALPALVEGDIDDFGAAISEIQATIGDHFAPAQGGRFTSSGVAELLGMLAGWGIAGLGQSSWGPTGFAFMRNEREARQCAGRLAVQAAAHGIELMVVGAANTGALIEQHSLGEVRAG